MDITVYSKPQCVQCDATYRALNRAGIPYRSIDVSVDAEALEYIKSLDYNQVPVVIVGDKHWSGYRPDRIQAVSALVLQPVG